MPLSAGQVRFQSKSLKSKPRSLIQTSQAFSSPASAGLFFGGLDSGIFESAAMHHLACCTAACQAKPDTQQLHNSNYHPYTMFHAIRNKDVTGSSPILRARPVQERKTLCAILPNEPDQFKGQVVIFQRRDS